MPHYYNQTDIVQHLIDEEAKQIEEQMNQKGEETKKATFKPKKHFRFHLPRFWKGIEMTEERKIKLWQMFKVGLSVFSFVVFMQFIIEEAVQMQSYGVGTIINRKDIPVSEKVKMLGKSEVFHSRMKLCMDGLNLINPISGFFFDRFMEANREKLDSYWVSIFKLSPEEIPQISLECELAEIGQKCRAEGFIFGIKTEKDWTSIVFGKNTLPKNPKYRDYGEENLKGTWIVTKAKVNYSLGELMDIYEMEDKLKKGDWIEVVGIKEGAEKEIEVRLGYLLFQKPKIEIEKVN